MARKRILALLLAAGLLIQTAGVAEAKSITASDGSLGDNHTLTLSYVTATCTIGGIPQLAYKFTSISATWHRNYGSETVNATIELQGYGSKCNGSSGAFTEYKSWQFHPVFSGKDASWSATLPTAQWGYYFIPAQPQYSGFLTDTRLESTFIYRNRDYVDDCSSIWITGGEICP